MERVPTKAASRGGESEVQTIFVRNFLETGMRALCRRHGLNRDIRKARADKPQRAAVGFVGTELKCAFFQCSGAVIFAFKIYEAFFEHCLFAGLKCGTMFQHWMILRKRSADFYIVIILN